MRIAFRCAVLLVAALAAGCAQDARQVMVRTGTGLDHAKPAADFAALYLPYARMASLAYTDPEFLRPNLCPDRDKLAHLSPRTAEQKRRNPANLAFLAALKSQGWHCAFGVIDPPGCPPDKPHCVPVTGLEMQAWIRGCTAAIAFRGTDQGDRGDLYSDFRFVRFFVNEFDQYEQVGLHTGQWIARLMASAPRCRAMRIAAVGHSLGGGLAQHAAYADGRVRYVYAFNPSPVTGLLDILPDILVGHREGLGIDRVNEGGEVLEGLRVVTGGFAQPARCNPRVRIVRFRTLGELPTAIDRHAIIDMTRSMERLAPGGRPAAVAGEARARSCNFVDDDEAP